MYKQKYFMSIYIIITKNKQECIMFVRSLFLGTNVHVVTNQALIKTPSRPMATAEADGTNQTGKAQ